MVRLIALAIATITVIAAIPASAAARSTKPTFDAAACVVSQADGTYLVVETTWSDTAPPVDVIQWTAYDSAHKDRTALGTVQESWGSSPQVGGATLATWALTDLPVVDWTVVRAIDVVFRDTSLAPLETISLRRPHAGWPPFDTGC